MQFQLASDRFEKKQYRTISTDDVIESIKCQKIPNNGLLHEDLVLNYGSKYCDLVEQIKTCNQYFYPYSLKRPKEPLEGKYIDELQFLVLDIDDKCTIKQFIQLNPKYKYYLYTTSTHQVTGKDKFRVIFPISKPIEISDAISRKASILEYFSFGDISYLDPSFLAKGRGFIVPIELEKFFEHESQSLEILDMTMFAKRDYLPPVTGQKIKTVDGMDNNKDVMELVESYKHAPESSEIVVNGKSYSRNDAFYKIHVEIAKFRVSEENQLFLAHEMNWDQKRNSVELTVDTARKSCRKIDLSALKKKSDNYEVKTKIVEFLEITDVDIQEGKKHLLTATTGTGKTTLVLDKMDRKIIFAAPLNSIIEQQSSRRECATLTGMSGVLPEADKVLCSYDALIALLDKNDLSEYLIVLDEFHRVLSDDFRLEKMSILVEKLKASNYTILCMSGTFDPTHLELFKFDQHFDFKADRPLREVQLLETIGILDNALIRVLKKFKPNENNLVLFDNKNKALAIQKSHPDITVISSDSKNDDVYKELIASGRIRGTVLTTQVLLEGIDLRGLDNVVIVATKYWSEGQIVQFFERDRDRTAKCYLLRKPISASDTYIPEAYKEKEYQNSFFDEVKRLGVSNMQLIGAKDLNKLIRIEGGEMYMNSLYPYWKQKAAMDNAIFKEGLQLQKYGYKIISEVEEISSKTVKALDEVKNLSNEINRIGYKLAVEDALDGKSLNSDFHSIFYLVGLLLEHGFSKQRTRAIANEPKELDAYKDRLTQPLPLLEKAIYQDFKIGQFYTCVDAKSKVTNAITNSPQSTVRVNSNYYFKILNRYYHIKRKSAKKGLEILGKREIPRTELCLNY
jgi:hypothetical protein